MQPLKAFSPILLTEFGILMLAKLLQSRNVPHLILLTDSGIVTWVKPVQPEKAFSPILSTDFGILT